VSSLRPSPADFFAKAVIRADPRHSALFLLEPTFLLAHLAQVSATMLDYLNDLLQFAKTIQPAPVDDKSDNDARFFRKLALFERVLMIMQGEELSDAPAMDGEAGKGVGATTWRSPGGFWGRSPLKAKLLLEQEAWITRSSDGEATRVRIR
jgi:hypothetical protein